MPVHNITTRPASSAKPLLASKIPHSLTRYASRLDYRATIGEAGYELINVSGIIVHRCTKLHELAKFLAEEETDIKVRKMIIQEGKRLASVDSEQTAVKTMNPDGNPLVGQMAFRSMAAWRRFRELMMAVGMQIGFKSGINDELDGSQLVEFRRRVNSGALEGVELWIIGIKSMEGFRLGGSL